MAKSKITPIGQAILDLINAYEIAKESDYVLKPISYALYHTWKQWDEKEKITALKEATDDNNP